MMLEVLREGTVGSSAAMKHRVSIEGLGQVRGTSSER